MISLRFAAAAMAAFSVAGMASAFVPGDVAVPVSPAGGALVAGGDLGAKYIAYGVDFTWGGVEGIFSDPPLAFGGVNGAGDIDLLSAVDGRIVLPNTLTTAGTTYLYAEAGFAGDGSLTLEVFDAAQSLVATLVNGPPLGQFGRTTFTYTGSAISYFRISGQDSFGVNEILLAPRGVVPEPMTWALMIAGFGMVGATLRRRTAAVA